MDSPDSSQQITSQVPVWAHGWAALDYLAKRFAYLSRDEWARRLADGRLSCGDQILEAASTITKGTLLVYRMPPHQEPQADLNYTVLYQDPWLLAVNKPGNLLVHHQGLSYTSNLVYQLRNVHQPPFPGCDSLHRLDRETSGVVLFARTKEALNAFLPLFKEKAIQKEYWAVVRGRPAEDRFVCDQPVGPLESSAVGSKQGVGGPKAKAALTEFEVLTRLPQGLTLVRCQPHTGRTHQIRVHLAHLGFPIVGDKMYGLSEAAFEQWLETKDPQSPLLDFPRQALHCRSMAGIHPFTGQPFFIEAPWPADLAKLVDTRDNEMPPSA